MDASALFRAHGRFVAGFLLRMGAPRRELDDLVQDVFLVAHRKGGYQPGPAQPTTWLANIALGELRNLQRRDRRRGAHHGEAPPSEPGDPTTGLGDRIEARDGLRRIDRALDELPEGQRSVFMLYEIEGQSCDSIAAGLDIAVGTVYSRLHAARTAFKRAYEGAQS
jgi:RNA polymerase sigma-70 factor (ECF subfamily)